MLIRELLGIASALDTASACLAEVEDADGWDYMIHALAERTRQVARDLEKAEQEQPGANAPGCSAGVSNLQLGQPYGT